MEKVFLRVYNREIEGMIEGGQLDEAVAHCQHILKTFPMHVETYRLLGKTFLEARRYADAADIFQRVLMAVPDDFVSHVGMSIIRDDEANLDNAIWHMERAFEVQPSNSAIQGELRRLYGRRDGTEPSKIRLSRDALANMYSQGELFNQAIAEIRSVLAEDPVRPDLQVMLMRAYYRSGQKVEAAEIATTLLKKYPYCLDSLRVLVDVLPGTARAENTQVYRHRLFLLDPYSSFTHDSTFSSDQVADSAVNLERLDYRPGATPSSPKPDWASSLGIKVTTEKPAEPPPAWMQTPEITEKPTDVTPEPLGHETAPIQKDAASTIPDWMRSGGWQDSPGEAKDGSTDTGQASSNEPIAKADIPDWLMSMAPAEIQKTEEIKPEIPDVTMPMGDDGIPDWLKHLPPTDGTGVTNLESQASISSTSESVVEPIAPVEAAGEKSMEPTSSIESQPSSGEELPDWLKDIVPGDSVTGTIQESQQPVETQPPGGEDVPDWLKSMAPADVTGISNAESELTHPEVPKMESETDQPFAEKPSTGGEPFPDWLIGMDEQEIQAAPSNAEIPEQSATGSETIPEYPVQVEPFSRAPVTPPISEIGISEESFGPSGEVKPFNDGDDSLSWLESLADKQGVEPEEQVTNPQDLSAAIPGWLSEPGEEHIEAPAVPAQEPVPPSPETLPLEPLDRFAAPNEPTPVQIDGKTFPFEEEGRPAEPPADAEAVIQPTGKPATFEEDTMAWLERLSAYQEKSARESLVKSGESLETIPVEDQKISEQQPTNQTPEEGVPVSQEPAADKDVTITSWLSQVDVQKALGKVSTEQPGAEKPSAPAEELPDWLKDLESPITPVITPKVGDDLPEWLRHPISPSEPGLTSQTGLASEPEVPTWIDENIQVPGQAAPTLPDEWVPVEPKPDTGLVPETILESTSVEETPPVTGLESIDEIGTVSESETVTEPEPASEPVSFSVHTLIHPPTLKQTGMLSPVPVQDKDAELLSNAQTILDQDSLDESMKQYVKLIKKGRLLDEVIHDLREAIYRYPVDVIIWQTLGDAYMRANRLQDALDTYSKAEELLR
jgi:tetratricopeptide (TPR) repeat protein